MKDCWPEGSLRAYYDGELPPADRERISAHLAECPDCEALADELAGRAARVAALMSALPEPEQVMWMPRRAGSPARVAHRGRWAAAAVALAAGVALGIWLSPKGPKPIPAPVARVEAIPRVPVEPPSDPQVAITQPVQSVRMPTRLRLTPRPAPKQVFFSLDDEPIETGIVVRVALGPAEIPADVVFGADGRAHAIRLVSNVSKH